MKLQDDLSVHSCSKLINIVPTLEHELSRPNPIYNALPILMQIVTCLLQLLPNWRHRTMPPVMEDLVYYLRDELLSKIWHACTMSNCDLILGEGNAGVLKEYLGELDCGGDDEYDGNETKNEEEERR